MNKKIGFIGCGNMGQAMIAGIIKSEHQGEKIIVSDRNGSYLNKVTEEFGVLTTVDNTEAASFSVL